MNCPKCGSENMAVPEVGMRCCFDCGFNWRPCPKCGRELEKKFVDRGAVIWIWICEECDYAEQDAQATKKTLRVRP